MADLDRSGSFDLRTLLRGDLPSGDVTRLLRSAVRMTYVPEGVLVRTEVLAHFQTGACRRSGAGHIDMLEWVVKEHPTALIRVCHPTTSNGGASGSEQDLVLEGGDGQTILVEVCDVVSARAASNDKERKTLKADPAALKGSQTAR